jgi:hypothetical protein
VCIPDKLPAYISWDQWEKNQKKLRENSTKFGAGPSRGASLIAGRITCGKCGARMAVSYKGNKSPYFNCCAARMNFGEPLCQSFEASSLEKLIERLVLTALQPASLELSLQATDSIESDRERLDQHHQQSVQRATYQAGLARRRYEEVDPENRLVAAELERSWESLLKTQHQCEESLNRFRQETPSTLTDEQKAAIRNLANDFSVLWYSDQTTSVDRQNIARTLIEHIVVDVVDDSERLAVTVHWAGGFTSQHDSRRRVQAFGKLEASQEIAERIQQLYNEGYPLSEIARQLNHEGFRPARGKQFTQTSMGALCRMLRRQGIIEATPNIAPNFWRAGALSNELGIAKSTLTCWRYRNWVQTRQVGNRWIYWANESELHRLRRLAINPPAGSIPAPEHLTAPVSKIPTEPDANSR